MQEFAPRERAEKTLQSFKALADEVSEQIVHYPVPSLAVAFTAGFLLATPSGRKFLQSSFPLVTKGLKAQEKFFVH